MFTIESIAIFSLLYLFLLFLIAYFGDSNVENGFLTRNRNIVYALSLAVYCSSWTFYGAVGTAAVQGLDYVAIYLGPSLVFLFGYPMMRRIIMLCKQNNITSVSDFIASRFGKSRRIGLLVTVIAVVGSLPYIALQLKAVTMSYLVLNSHGVAAQPLNAAVSADAIALYTGIILALFAILFGTRHLDTTEHHRGMVLAISFESIVKLAAIVAVGYYSFYLLLDNSSHDSFSKFVSSGSLSETFADGSSTWVSFLTKTFLSMGAIILLPRQFQVTVVESFSHRQFKTAMWVMPIYLMTTSIIVIPIALAGSILLPNGQEDLYVLTLPLTAGNEALGMVAFIGGLSAATGMVIVSVISLSTMVCNDLVMPNLIRLKSFDILKSDRLDQIILLIRRLAIIVLIGGAYGYYILIDSNALLANIGLISFAAVMSFLPAVVCALYWRRAHSRGVFWGLIGGFGVWFYTLMLPTILDPQVVEELWGSKALLHPQRLFGVTMGNPLTHGVIWSLLTNISILLFFSLREEQSMLEKMQASRFFHTGDTNSPGKQPVSLDPILVHPDALRILAERIIGRKNTQNVFEHYEQSTGSQIAGQTAIDRTLLTLVQTAIAGVIGSSSAQKVIADTIIGSDDPLEEATTLVDQTSSVLQFNRNLLQTALQNITHGISVVDEDLNLVVWNDRYVQLFDYPENFIYVGKPIKEVLEYNARRGDFGDKDSSAEIRKRLSYLQKRQGYKNTRKRPNGVVIKSIGEPMPGGGFVTTYEDISESVKASAMLHKANEELEDRVQERTLKLEVLTQELERTTRSKTHFLAAASHDLLQPINAARLFASSVSERSDNPQEVKRLADSIDQSLVTANELLRALLDISKLDAGGIKPKPKSFALSALGTGLSRDLESMALSKNIRLTVDVANLQVLTDRQLLLSVLQNLTVNALRYTNEGGSVSVQAEQQGDEVVISVTDTGVGIAADSLDDIFTEFFQIKSGQERQSSGLGLGLSIVRRICLLLKLDIKVVSTLGVGSTFSIRVPLADSDAESEQSPSQHQFTAPAERLVGLPVLCIDNDQSVLNAMQTLLEGWGCDVTTVTTYRQAKRAFEHERFKIFLADYRLDFEETGLDFLAFISESLQSEGEPAPSGVLITAEQDESLQVRANNLGFQYLSKPIEPAALKSLMLYLSTQT